MQADIHIPLQTKATSAAMVDPRVRDSGAFVVWMDKRKHAAIGFPESTRDGMGRISAYSERYGLSHTCNMSLMSGYTIVSRWGMVNGEWKEQVK